MRTILVCSIVATVLGLMHSSDTFAQATRTWVSGVGDDANPCSRTAPCKTFAGAISKTAPNGIINCLDPGGFGALTITKSITIDCSATFGGVLAALTNGINVNAGASDVVTLRGLSIEGAGTGLIGVNYINGGVLHVENCRIFGFRSGSATGIFFGGSGHLFVSNTTFTSNGFSGTGGAIVIRTAGGMTVKGLITNSEITENSFGVLSDATSGQINLQIINSVVTGNIDVAVTARGGSSLFLDRVTAAANDTGIVSDGGSAQVLLTNSNVANNFRGINTINGGFAYSYVTNSINANMIDGSISGNISQR